MTYRILETVNEENWRGKYPTQAIHRFKNKNELISFLLDYVNDTSEYWQLELIE